MLRKKHKNHLCCLFDVRNEKMLASPGLAQGPVQQANNDRGGSARNRRINPCET